MKPCIILRVYILTDQNGEWWETLKIDGSLNRFKSGTGTYKRDKQFKTPEQAVRAGNCLNTRYKVVRLSPPVPPSITWGEDVLVEFPPEPTGVLVA